MSYPDEFSVHERLHLLQVDKILKEGVHDDLLHNRISLAEGKQCPLCLKRDNPKIGIGTMRKKSGPYGVFLSCSLYPLCKFSWNAPTIRDTDSDTDSESPVSDSPNEQKNTQTH